MLPPPHRFLPQRNDHMRRRFHLLRRRSVPIPVPAPAAAAAAAAAALPLAHQADALGKAVVRMQLPGRELPRLPRQWHPLARTSPAAVAPACACNGASTSVSASASSTTSTCAPHRGIRLLHRDHRHQLLPLGVVEASHLRSRSSGQTQRRQHRLEPCLRLHCGRRQPTAAATAAAAAQ